jgi:hypothetical protein
MALKFKILGQSTSLTGNSNVTLYGVPYYTSTLISSLTVCNYGSGSATFDIAFCKSGANIISQHYFSYHTPIAANETISISAGITLDQTDLVRVSANTANVSFNLFGSENNQSGFFLGPTIEYLIVAGGGSASSSRGGGAGGYRIGTFSILQTGATYTINVGAGGSYASGGTTGNDSYISGGMLSYGIVSSAGGGGTKSGGSGGGQGLGNVPATSPPQGNDGSTTSTGGGGGAGAAGSAKNGGVGLYTDISGTYRPYSGGGGGGDSSGTGGNGGDGGGGRGRGGSFGNAGSYANGFNGGTNSGGGGGSPGTGGNGGSGVVIIRYSDQYTGATVTGSVSTTVSGGYITHNWSGSGTFVF